jgi:chromosome segregation ATPase
MTTEHPEIKSLQARLAALESLRESVVAAKPAKPELDAPVAQRSGPRPTPEWKAQQMRVELEIDALRKQLALAKSQFETADDRLTRFERLHSRLVAKDEDIRGLLERRQNATRELGIWQGHLANLERIMAAESGERGTQFTLIEEPEKIAFPIRPAVASVFAGCSGFSLAIAALLVALAELFDRSFRTAGQVSRSIGLPLLATVGILPTPRERRRAVIRRAIWTPTLMALMVVLSGSVWVAYASLRMPAEHARALTRLGHAADAAGVPNLLPLPAQPESD